MDVDFVASYQTPIVLQPADRPFNLPALTIPSQGSTVLRHWPLPPPAVRRDQLDPSTSESLSQAITVGGPIVNQSLGKSGMHPLFQQRFNQLDFRSRSVGHVDCQGDSVAVDEDHNLGSFSLLGRSDAVPPFFAGENVASAIACSQSTPCRLSSFRKARSQALVNRPLSVQSLSLRQQVAGDGKDFGKSFHRAPVRRTHRIPSRQARELVQGRPPAEEGGGGSKRSAIRNHCSSVSCHAASVLDAVARRAAARLRISVVFIRETPLSRMSMQLACQAITRSNYRL